MNQKKYDVIVAGSGPAGLSVASHCSKKGLKTACISPDIDETWENNFGVWRDEIEGLGLDDTFNQCWEKSDFIFTEKLTKTFNRAYIQFDRDKLKAKFIEMGDKNNLDIIKGKLKRLEHKESNTLLWSEDGDQYETSIVIDASGFDPVFLNRPGKKADTWQIAYGVMAKVDKHPFPVDRFVMMDFRYKFLKGDDYPPTICYIMPFSSDTIFFEETSIVDRPAVEMELLQERLQKRLDSLDVTILDKDWEEFCYIPTNMPFPDLKQRVIGFGAAACYVHPNTGYSVSLSLKYAPKLAETIYQGLNADNVSLEKIAQNAWKTIWPSYRRRMDIANKLGMGLFCIVSIRQLSFILRRFFSCPDKVWQGYLSNDARFLDLLRGFFKLPGRSR